MTFNLSLVKTVLKMSFFHLFNTLYEQGKNIIFSSDKHPNHIIGLEDRLKTRFNAGMTIDIQEPDLESTYGNNKSKKLSVQNSLADEVLSFVAISVTGSIREIEGANQYHHICTNEMKQKPVFINRGEAFS
jgi:chromosomal replication initiation ATPase DnaA